MKSSSLLPTNIRGSQIVSEGCETSGCKNLVKTQMFIEDGSCIGHGGLLLVHGLTSLAVYKYCDMCKIAFK